MPDTTELVGRNRKIRHRFIYAPKYGLDVYEAYIKRREEENNGVYQIARERNLPYIMVNRAVRLFKEFEMKVKERDGDILYHPVPVDRASLTGLNVAGFVDVEDFKDLSVSDIMHLPGIGIRGLQHLVRLSETCGAALKDDINLKAFNPKKSLITPVTGFARFLANMSGISCAWKQSAFVTAARHFNSLSEREISRMGLRTEIRFLTMPPTGINGCDSDVKLQFRLRYYNNRVQEEEVPVPRRESLKPKTGGAVGAGGKASGPIAPKSRELRSLTVC